MPTKKELELLVEQLKAENEELKSSKRKTSEIESKVVSVLLEKPLKAREIHSELPEYSVEQVNNACSYLARDMKVLRLYGRYYGMTPVEQTQFQNFTAKIKEKYQEG